jgi:hypothetical protein
MKQGSAQTPHASAARDPAPRRHERAIHSESEANIHVTGFVTSALAGEPQIIRKRDGRAVIILDLGTAKDLVALAERPRSLARISQTR